MRKIAITGGKGGTGKSTVSILLTNKFREAGEKVVLCDCDVECPNDHLLLGQELEKPEGRAFAQFPKLNKEKCQKCGLCAQNCRSNAIFQAPGEYPVFIHELCSGCGLCWNLCPHQAIETEKRAIGEIFVNEILNPTFQPDGLGKLNPSGLGTHRVGGVWLVTGRSVGVVDETGPIVTETRKFAERFAGEVEADYLLLDTAPGMHCSVIRALIDADLAYVVTEPTPLGAHDLKLILELLKKLPPSPRLRRASGVPAKIVLNQADLGDREPIDKIAKEFGVRIEFEIPYSREIVEAYSKGELSKINLL